MDPKPFFTNDMNSPKVTAGRRQMRGWQPGHQCNSPALACSATALAHNMLNTRSLQRFILFDSMEDHVTTAHMQSKQMTCKRMKNCFALWSND